MEVTTYLCQNYIVELQRHSYSATKIDIRIQKLSKALESKHKAISQNFEESHNNFHKKTTFASLPFHFNEIEIFKL